MASPILGALLLLLLFMEVVEKAGGCFAFLRRTVHLVTEKAESGCTSSCIHRSVLVATAVAVGARWLKIPYTVALVLAGLAIGASHTLEAPHLTKELLFAVILPGLVFEAASTSTSASSGTSGSPSTRWPSRDSSWPFS